MGKNFALSLIVALKGNDELVVVVGQGYVGLPLAMASVQAGHRVLGIDLNVERVKAIGRGQSPVADVRSEDLSEALSRGLYSIGKDYEGCRGFSHAIITVPTPLRAGKPDLSFIEAAAASLAPFLSRGSAVILESTTYPGTTEELLVPILEGGSGLMAGSDFYVGYSPERIDPGNKEWNLTNTPKVVSGIDEHSLRTVDDFYRGLGIPTVKVSGTREAELTKLLENTSRHVNIALVNEIANFSGALGVDIWEAVEAAATKPFGFMKFTPGPGVGGHCLPIDPSYLSWAVSEKTEDDFRFVELANTINGSMPKYVAERALEILRGQKCAPAEARVLISGLAYKPNTSDIRESPAVAVAEHLASAGVDIQASDELVSEEDWPPGISRVELEGEGLFNLGILITDHSIASSSALLKACDVVLDTGRSLTGTNVIRLWGSMRA